VDAERGSAGFYRLAAGANVPPLLLDDEEAVAVAVALHLAGGLSGIEETSARTLAKLEKVLPHRLRPTVAAVQAAVTRGPAVTDGTGEGAPVAPAVLADIASAIRDNEWLRFDYGDDPRAVEPYRLVNWQRRWYLVARDARTGDWGTFRVDWLTLRAPTRRRFAPRGLDEDGYAELVVREVASTGWSVHARITVLASADEVLARINPAVGVVEPVSEHESVLVTGADSYEVIAVYIGMLGMDFRIDGPAELVEHVNELGERYRRATAG
jgi:predicted DNA-binding transcriptional regulator YafY